MNQTKYESNPIKTVSQIGSGKLILIQSKTLGRIESEKYESNPVDYLDSDRSESTNPNTSNSDNFIGNSNLPCINFQTESSSNTLFMLQK